MRTLLCWIMVAVCFAGSAFGQESEFFNRGAFSLKLTASLQSVEDLIVSSKSRTNALGTTTVHTIKSVVTNTPFTSVSLLKLLENSFNTNFPAGARLTVSLSYFHNPYLYVTDRTGTNILWGPGTNLIVASMAYEEPLTSERRTITTIAPSGGGMTYSDQSSSTITQTLALSYNDEGLPTRDGTHSRFRISFLAVENSSLKGSTDKFSATLKLQGFGGGVLRDQDVIFQGTASAILQGQLR